MNTIGLRQPAKISKTPRPPTVEEQTWIKDMAKKQQLLVPKGIFRYRSHEEANRDWTKWMVQSIKEQQRRNG